MELEGHPTQDLVEELQRRGGIAYPGSDAGPDDESLEMARHRKSARPGLWIYLPREAYETEIDEEPPIP